MTEDSLSLEGVDLVDLTHALWNLDPKHGDNVIQLLRDREDERQILIEQIINRIVQLVLERLAAKPSDKGSIEENDAITESVPSSVVKVTSRRQKIIEDEVFAVGD